jgi:hypothetical protein
MAEVLDPAQAAWAQYLSTHYLDRFTIQEAHRAFLAGWKAATENDESRQT